MSDLIICKVSKYIDEQLKLEDITLSMNREEVITIQCTPSESKLLMQLIMQEVKPTAGSIIIGDNTKIRYVFSSSFDPLLTAFEVIKFYVTLSLTAMNVHEVMDVFGINEFASIRIGKLSVSQKILLGFGVAYVQNPNIIIANESTFEHQKKISKTISRIIKYIKSKGIGVLLFTALKEEALLLGDKAYYLANKGLTEFETNEGVVENKKYRIEKIPVKLENKIILLNPYEIDFIEAFNNNTCIYVNGKQYNCNLNMSQIETRLNRFGFFRNHRSYLVNLQKIKEVVIWSKNTYSLVLNDKVKSSIPISKARLDNLKSLINF